MPSVFNFVSPRERILYLKSIPYLSALSSQQLLPLAECARERTYPAGAVLLRADRPVDAALLVVSGEVALHWDGRKILDARAPQGIGLLGMLARVERGIEAIATTPVQTLEIAARDLFRVYERNFSVLGAIIASMAEEIIALRSGYPADPKNPPVAGPGSAPDGPLEFVDRLLGYSRNSLFRDSNLDAISELVQQQSERRWQPGETIWSKADHAAWDLWIIHGVVDCDPEDGRATMSIGANYTLGMETLADRARGYTARAQTEVIAMVTPAEVYQTILEDHPELSLSVAASIARLLISARGSVAMDPPKLPFTDRSVADIYSTTSPRTVM